MHGDQQQLQSVPRQQRAGLGFARVRTGAADTVQRLAGTSRGSCSSGSTAGCAASYSRFVWQGCAGFSWSALAGRAQLQPIRALIQHPGQCSLASGQPQRLSAVAALVAALQASVAEAAGSQCTVCTSRGRQLFRHSSSAACKPRRYHAHSGSLWCCTGTTDTCFA